ncbi:HlyD family efflux transporter periplasmic adaptor subunit [bacterium]|nr:MAG: HlyD family efflux transporter periplasmic adaptor subunit [bacterium]
MAIKAGKPVFILFLLVVAGTALFLFLSGRNGAAAPGIKINGNIEVTDARVSFKIAGRVAERLVSEGDRVTAGQLVARLDSADLEREIGIRSAELRSAKALLAELTAGSRPEEIAQAALEVDRASAQLDELIAGSRPEELKAGEAGVARAAEGVSTARLAEENAKTEYERMEKLFAKGFVAERDRDNARTAYETAKTLSGAAKAQLEEAKARQDLLKAGAREEAVTRARAALSQAKERHSLVKKGPRSEEIESARARVSGAEEGLSLARTRLGYAEALSPLTGVSVTQNVEPGEYVNPGTPVVTVADLENVWLRGYIEETDLGRVKIGQRVEVKADTYPGKSYEGAVTFISSEAEFTPRSVQTQKERVKLVYRIKVSIKNPAMELKPGMPAEGVIFVDAG